MKITHLFNSKYLYSTKYIKILLQQPTVTYIGYSRFYTVLSLFGSRLLETVGGTVVE